MKIKNFAKENPLEIEFDLSILKERYLKNEDFCLCLDLKIYFDEKVEKYTEIVIDKCSIEKMIFTIRDFISNNEEELYYEPLEADFWMYIPKPPKSRKDVIQELIDAGLSENDMEEMLEMEYLNRLFFLIDIKKYKYGFPTGTGIAYCLDVKSYHLEQFVDELEQQYYNLLKSL